MRRRKLKPWDGTARDLSPRGQVFLRYLRETHAFLERTPHGKRVAWLRGQCRGRGVPTHRVQTDSLVHHLRFTVPSVVRDVPPVELSGLCQSWLLDRLPEDEATA